MANHHKPGACRCTRGTWVNAVSHKTAGCPSSKWLPRVDSIWKFVVKTSGWTPWRSSTSGLTYLKISSWWFKIWVHEWDEWGVKTLQSRLEPTQTHLGSESLCDANVSATVCDRWTWSADNVEGSSDLINHRRNSKPRLTFMCLKKWPEPIVRYFCRVIWKQ